MRSWMRAGAGRVLPFVASGVAALVLTGCIGSGNTKVQVIVDFVDIQHTAGQAQLTQRCGGLPGVTPEAVQAGDPRDYFDITKATTGQQKALETCIDQTQVAFPAVGVRGYVVDDGTDN